MKKRLKHMPTDSYFYLARNIVKCMMSNLCGPVRMQKMNMQNMSNSKISTQKMSNLHVCSTDEGKLKSINADTRKSKRVNINACSTEESKLKTSTK